MKKYLLLALGRDSLECYCDIYFWSDDLEELNKMKSEKEFGKLLYEGVHIYNMTNSKEV